MNLFELPKIIFIDADRQPYEDDHLEEQLQLWMQLFVDDENTLTARLAHVNRISQSMSEFTGYRLKFIQSFMRADSCTLTIGIQVLGSPQTFTDKVFEECF